MKTKLIFIAFIAAVIMVLSVQISRSQVTQVWEQRYNGTADSTDNSYEMTVDLAGNVYVAGSSRSTGGAYDDMVTIKYNSEGTVQWLQRYNGTADSTDYAESIAVDDAGNVYVVGSSMGTGSHFDFVAIKYNSQGVQQWLQRYDGPNNNRDFGEAITIDGSGNVYVAGSSLGNGSDYDYAVIKYNSSGMQQWLQRYNGSGNASDSPFFMALDNAGNVYITGYSSGVGTGLDIMTTKYSSSGTLLWDQRFNGTGNGVDVGNSVAVDGTGNVYISGYSSGSTTGFDIVTIKYNSSGTQQWQKTYNGPANSSDLSASMAIDASGNVYVTGYSMGNSSGEDYATIKYSTSGDELWIQRYNGSGNTNDESRSLAVDGSGNVYVTGLSGSGTNYDYATIKYNSLGTQQWEQRYNGLISDRDEATWITLDTSGSVFVTGNSRSNTGFDIVTIKYSQTVGIQSVSNEIPKAFSLSQNYPNPFNPKTNIGLRVADFGFVSLKVFDITGKEVALLVSQELSAGVYNVDFDASNHSSGTYFYSMETAGFRDVKKMVVVK